MTVPEKRDLVVHNKKIEFLMLVGRLNRCFKILKEKNLVCAEGRPAQLTLF